MIQGSSSALLGNLKGSTITIPAKLPQVATNKPDPNHLSVVYNSDDISSYFERHPSLVMLRVFQIAGEVMTMFFVGMIGMLEGTSDDYNDEESDNSDNTKSDLKLQKSKMKMAGAVRDSMVRMGPTFIKLGQALSSRQDLIGLEGISQLQRLQDAIPATFSTEDARAIIKQDLELGNDLVDQLLSTLSAEPVAAASLGQVYKATIDGVAVAVKVQRPDLREQVAADFLLARWGADFLTKTGILKSDGVGAVDEYASRLFEELDYINEANNLKKFSQLYSDNGSAAKTLPLPGIIVPRLYEELCSPRVLVMTWLEGEKLIKKDATVSLADLGLVQLGIQCTLSQILETGILHADPHGGNLLKGPEGKLAYIDFGLVASVPISVREALVCSVVHLVERNYGALAREFDSLMLMPADALKVDLNAFEIALKEVAETVLDFSPRQNEQLKSFETEKQNQQNFEFDVAVGRIKSTEIIPETGVKGIRHRINGFMKNPVLNVLIGFLGVLEKSTSNDVEIEINEKNSKNIKNEKNEKNERQVNNEKNKKDILSVMNTYDFMNGIEDEDGHSLKNEKNEKHENHEKNAKKEKDIRSVLNTYDFMSGINEEDNGFKVINIGDRSVTIDTERLEKEKNKLRNKKIIGPKGYYNKHYLENKNDLKVELNVDSKGVSQKDFDDDEEEDVATPIPRVKFDEIISALFAVATRFSFTVPPYFLNNVRAIGSLEGMALTADPNFSLLEVVYPYVLRKVLSDFSYEDIDKNIGNEGTQTDALSALMNLEGYQNIHDDTVKRLGAGASHTASGKTKEVFRSMILRKDKQSGLLLPRW
eukprot:CAMPEP_0119053258 /NCGR_PEP_ID=MMETSP1177-20130426/74319_1 /TAXON_ID=2985 /ORGANISM="Ochromonas sp, Strain CCMP1899" /LENGTH=820 /DNA_ID=CAMNT_0007033169 /DNA_START=102 /DNA_END=2561 /DNA_ORIENTATION=+